MLNHAFNFSNFNVVKYENSVEKKELIEHRKEKEDKLFNEVVKNLTEDLEFLGFEKTYSSEIIINMVAQNIVLMHRFKLKTAFNKLIIPESKFVCEKIITTRQYYSGKTRNEKYYDNILIGEKIDPLYEKYLPKLQKQISDGLKSLGLHPTQLVERQKITIVKKIRQKYEEIERECVIKTKTEKQINSKKDNNIRNRIK